MLPDPRPNMPVPQEPEPAKAAVVPVFSDETEVNVFSFLADIGVTDLESLGVFLKRRVPLIAAAVVVATVIAVFYGLRQIDIFAAAAKVQLAPPPIDPVNARYTLYAADYVATDYVNTEIQVIKSRLFASNLLSTRPELSKALRESAPHAQGDPVVTVQGAISVRALKDTRIIEIACEDVDPKLAALLANTVADAYCDYKQEERSKTASSSVRAIDEQIPQVKKQIEEDQTELDKLAQGENSFEHERDLVIDRLKSYNEALNLAQKERVHADADLEAIKRVKVADRPIESAPAIALSPTVQRLRADLAQAEIEWNQLIERGYREDCPLPKVKSVRSRRDDLKLELASEIETIRSGLEALRDAKLSEEQGLQKLVTQLQEEAMRLARQTQRHAFLETKIENNQKLYQDLLRRASELATYKGIEMATVKVVDHSEVPGSPVRPNRARITLLGTVMGILVGFLFAYIAERFDTRLRSAADVKGQLGLDSLALVPEIENLPSPELERLAITQPGSPFAESFRRLRAQLHATTTARVILVTSGAPAEGKSTAAINLAVATAKAGSRVLLIDADMRNPRVHRAFHLEVEPGLADLLDGRTPSPMKLVNETEVPNLHVISAGRSKKNAAELLAGGQFVRIITALKERFDRIVIDTPPAAFLSDASIMVPAADTVLLVVSTRRSRRRASRLAIQSLAGVGVKPAGVLLNHLSDLHLRALYYEYYKDYDKQRHTPVETSHKNRD
jgi:capsular exopolysaccharide synthesis family protein